MRKSTLFVILVLGLFLIACSNQESTLKETPVVKLFYAINDNVTYSEMKFSDDSAGSIADLVKSECPQGVGNKFTRSVYKSEAFTLTVYSVDKNITCSVLKQNNVTGLVQKKTTDAPDEETLVLVNGKAVTKTQLREAVASLPQGTQVDANTVAQLADNLIDKELLRQEEAKITVTSEEVAKVRENMLTQLDVKEEDLPALLAKQKIEVSAFNAEVEAQAKLEKLFSERLLTKDIQISDADAKEYYMANPNQFLLTEQAVMRHIFLKGKPSEYAAKAQVVDSKLNNTDFCELVKQYSDDNASVSQCGIYTIPHGVIDPNLERAGFATPVNKTSVVVTADGIHYVQTLKVTQAQVVPYADVSSKLQLNLRNVIFQQRLNLYLVSLRAKSNIVTFLA